MKKNYIVTRDEEDISSQAVATALSDARNHFFHALMAQAAQARQVMRVGQRKEWQEEYGQRIGVPAEALGRAERLSLEYMAACNKKAAGEALTPKEEEALAVKSPLYVAYAAIAIAIGAQNVAALTQMPMPFLPALQEPEEKLLLKRQTKERTRK